MKKLFYLSFVLSMLFSCGAEKDDSNKDDDEKEYVQQKMQQMQQQAQNQEPNPAMVMAQAEMLKGQADLLEQQNRQAEMSISAGKIQSEDASRREKLQSETALNVAKIQQNQEKQEFAHDFL